MFFSMLPVVPAELPSPGGELPPAGPFAQGASGELATFAELLRRPFPAPAPWSPAVADSLAGAGGDRSLPPGGKELPVDAAAEPFANPDLLSVLEQGDLLPEHPAGPMPAAAAAADAAAAPPATALFAPEYRIEVRAPARSSALPAMEPGAGGEQPGVRPLQAPADAWRLLGPERMTAADFAVEDAASLAAGEPASDPGDRTPGDQPPGVFARDGGATGTTRPAPMFDAMLVALGREGSMPAQEPSLSSPTFAAAVHGTPAAHSAPATAAPTAPPVPTSVAVALGDPAWADAFGEQVVVLAGKQVQRAEIRLHPAELGPIHVQVTVEDDTTRLAFSAQHAVTREAIEQALPRLKELFTDQGLSLADASVAGHGAKGERDTGFAGRGPDPTLAAPDLLDETEDPGAPRPVSARRSLVDLFA